MPLDNLSTADLVKNFNNPTENLTLSGIGVSAGIVIGKAFVWKNENKNHAVIESKTLSAEAVTKEIVKFDNAFAKTIEQLQTIINGINKEDYTLSEFEIIEAHLMLLEDPSFSNAIREIILTQRISAENGVCEHIKFYCQLFDSSNDVYLRQRKDDFKDIGNRIISNLYKNKSLGLGDLVDPCIVVAHDLAPSDTVGLNRKTVLGMVTEEGSRVSHTAILARALTLPAVVGVGNSLQATIATGDMLIIDGARGVIVVRPTEAQIEEYKEKISQESKWFEQIKQESDLPAETIDGFQVQLAANVEMVEELSEIKSKYGVGIGLFRTEFLFICSNTIPTEEEQFAVYRKTVEEIFPRSVIFRTLDLGGDKLAHTIPFDEEANPVLGVRAIRYCLKHPDIFITQLRALLRASNFGKVRIMFPMISNVDELTESLRYLDIAKKQLDEEGQLYNPDLDIGIMIEIPSAVELADKLSPLVDFFSCGTNDLVQYTMAVDRLNAHVSNLYQPMNPAILRMLYRLTNTAYNHGRWVGICGESASELIMLPLLIGCGIQEFSMSVSSLTQIKSLVRRIKMHEAEELVHKAMECATTEEVVALSKAYLQKVDPEIFNSGVINED